MTTINLDLGDLDTYPLVACSDGWTGEFADIRAGQVLGLFVLTSGGEGGTIAFHHPEDGRQVHLTHAGHAHLTEVVVLEARRLDGATTSIRTTSPTPHFSMFGGSELQRFESLDEMRSAHRAGYSPAAEPAGAEGPE